MPVLTGDMKFTGTMGGFSAYRLKGSDKIIIRRKGGPERNKLKTHTNYTLTRQNNQEWKASILAGQQLVHAIHPIKHLNDHSYFGSLMGIMKSIQKDDTTNPLGQRSVLISQSAYKLEGFSLNKYNSFENIVKHPLQYAIDKFTGTAWVQLPELVPGINLGNPMKQPLYRVIITLGAVADIFYNQPRNRYEPGTDTLIHPVTASTDWCSYKQSTAATLLTAQLNIVSAHPQLSLVLAVGIEFGVPVSNTEIRPVKYAGAAKVVRVG